MTLDVVGRSESGGGDRQDRWSSPPARGNTVYVHGHGVSEDVLQRAFAKIGGIVNINMDALRKLVALSLTVMLLQLHGRA